MANSGGMETFLFKRDGSIEQAAQTVSANTVNFSADGSKLAVGYENGVFEIWTKKRTGDQGTPSQCHGLRTNIETA